MYISPMWFLLASLSIQHDLFVFLVSLSHFLLLELLESCTLALYTYKQALATSSSLYLPIDYAVATLDYAASVWYTYFSTRLHLDSK